VTTCFVCASDRRCLSAFATWVSRAAVPRCALASSAFAALPLLEAEITRDHILLYVLQFWVARVVSGTVPKPRRDRFLYVSFGEERSDGDLYVEQRRLAQAARKSGTASGFVRAIAKARVAGISISNKLLKLIDDTAVRGYYFNVL
jgi:hypothetical protein